VLNGLESTLKFDVEGGSADVLLAFLDDLLDEALEEEQVGRVHLTHL
jgi:hypothetical protein